MDNNGYIKVDIASYYPSEMLGKDTDSSKLSGEPKNKSQNYFASQNDMASQQNNGSGSFAQNAGGPFASFSNMISNLLQSLNLNNGNLLNMLTSSLGDNAGLLGLINALGNKQSATQNNSASPLDLTKIFASKKDSKTKDDEVETSHIIRTFKSVDE